MSALSKVVRSGVHRRWVQTVVITLATAAAVTAGLLGVGLLVASNAPFDHAFVAQNGAHLNVLTDPKKATAAQLAATADADGVTETAGPFPTAQVMMLPPPPPGMSDPEGARGPMWTVVGRTGPGDSVDRVTLTDGRWAQNPDEVVVRGGSGFRTAVGQTVRLGESPNRREVTVVGLARSVSDTADAWMTPAGLAALKPPVTSYQMLYRFSDAGTDAQLTTARKTVAAALPDGAVTSAKTWLTVKKAANVQTSLFVPFLLAFGGLSLLLSVLIVGTVIAGAVGSTLRRIGILKALGFTPAQVVRAYVAQALIPAVIGAGIGAVAGNLIAVPLLTRTEDLYGTVALTIAPWVDVVVLGGVLLIVTVTASAAAGRAGRLSAVDALAVGRTPAARRGQYAARLAGRLPLPRPVTLGLARPFSAPLRAGAMVVAIAFGAAAVTLAAGLATSLNRIQVAAEHSGAQIIVDSFGPQNMPPGGEREGPPAKPDPVDPAKVTAVLDAQEGTGRYVGVKETEAAVPGISGNTTYAQYTANPGWAGYELVSGRWFTKPGEAVVPTEVLRNTDRELGDTITVTPDEGAAVTLTIVGEVFDPGDNDGLVMTQGAADLQPGTWQVGVADGTDVTAYAQTLTTALEPLGLGVHIESEGVDELILIIDALAGLLTLMLVTVAGLGVLNAVVLDVRARVHDIGIHKALGMTPRQTLTAVLSSVALIGLAGGLIGVPAGVLMHGIMVPAMGHGAGVELPPVIMTVFHPVQLTIFALGGLALAGAGALLPAGWAAKTRTATALRTE
ncbi:ABC transporter permease [Cryptosporangium aurantiacum]|uniref:Putative ABC transport system permease protein n=1 Tax=Cryptosporangium aurantiacum TaxID=134849 RepID=A0A1M7RB83_9ACTN|nr:ABC transporter permease [Cryptosporangium aurantiacum]SHN43523.1 putative ABC transport system permease protein [Cryptosporangium aurantiacum]